MLIIECDKLCKVYKNTYPSPNVESSSLTNEHINIAKEINDKMRDVMFIDDHIQFDFKALRLKGVLVKTYLEKRKIKINI